MSKLMGKRERHGRCCIAIQVSAVLTIAALGALLASWYITQLPSTMVSFFRAVKLDHDRRRAQLHPYRDHHLTQPAHTVVSINDDDDQVGKAPTPTTPTTTPSHTASSTATLETLLALARRRQQFRRYKYLTDAQLLQDAVDASALVAAAAATSPPRIAFLFLVRGPIPFEPLWRRFFAGRDELYSLYVHAAPGYRYPATSLFFQKEIQSKHVERMSRSLVDAVRRLLAFALLDPDMHNTWFVNICEATIPLRSIDFTYNYLMGSRHSFVQSFRPVSRYFAFETRPEFEQRQLRKGEVWMALARRHALAVVDDTTIYAKFAAECGPFCTFDEEYFQTLLHLRDRDGIENRTVMFVDWSDPHHGSAPRGFRADGVNASFLQAIATLTVDSAYGQHIDTAADNAPVVCAYNGVAGASCFLFARKFYPSCLDPLQKLVDNKVLNFLSLHAYSSRHLQLRSLNTEFDAGNP